MLGFICTTPRVCHNQQGDSQHVHSGRGHKLSTACVHLCERDRSVSTRVLVFTRREPLERVGQRECKQSVQDGISKELFVNQLGLK